MKTVANILFLLLPLCLRAQQIIVDADGTGNFKTIQEAVNSIRDLSQQQVKIYIKKGTYHEKIVVPSWKTNIAFIGEDRDSTIITNDDFSGKLKPDGKFSTFTSYTVLVQGNDFRAENITIQNTAGRVGQGVALHVEGDRAIIKNCKLLGNQDTLYAGKENSRQYYQDCYIEGSTDFIFGEATVVFQNCTIKSMVNSFITAAATSPRQPFGFVLMNCKLIADTAAKKVYLGRPWRPYARTVFIHCELGSHIVPAGWDPWAGDARFPDKEKTTYYAEYGNTGPGAAVKERVAWSNQLTAAEVKKYTIKNILEGSDNWDPAISSTSSSVQSSVK
jgi:pectinesterase